MNSTKLFSEITNSWESSPTPQRIKTIALKFDVPELDLNLFESQKEEEEFGKDDDQHEFQLNRLIFEGNVQTLAKEIEEQKMRKEGDKRSRFFSDFIHSKNQKNSILYYLETKKRLEEGKFKRMEKVIMGEKGMTGEK